jgi:hypothetical protein
MFKINWLGIVLWLMRNKLNGGEINRLTKSLNKFNVRYRLRALRSAEFREQTDIIERIDPKFYAHTYLARHNKPWNS